MAFYAANVQHALRKTEMFRKAPATIAGATWTLRSLMSPQFSQRVYLFNVEYRQNF